MRGGEGKAEKVCLEVLCYRSLRSSDFRRKRRKGKKLTKRLVNKGSERVERREREPGAAKKVLRLYVIVVLEVKITGGGEERKKENKD